MAETELKLVLEGSRGQKEAQELTEGGSGQEGKKASPANGAEGETVPTNQRLGRKSRRGAELHPFTALQNMCNNVCDKYLKLSVITQIANT